MKSMEKSQYEETFSDSKCYTYPMGVAMYDPWFYWALAGIACIGMEMLMPGFVIFFFGMGALATALCTLIPFVGGALWFQIVLFVAFSIVSLVFLRKKFAKVFAGTVFDSRKGSATQEDGVGEIVDMTESIEPPADGRIRFRGTTWKARSVSGAISAGEHVRIVSRENVTYIVEKADQPVKPE